MSERTNGGGSSLKHLMETALNADVPIAVVDVRDDWGRLTGCIVAVADPEDFDLARDLRDKVLQRHPALAGKGEAEPLKLSPFQRAFEIARRNVLEHFHDTAHCSPDVPGCVYVPPEIQVDIDGEPVRMNTGNLMLSIPGTRMVECNYWRLESLR